MRALQLVAPREMEVQTVADPPDPGPGEVAVRLRACGVCGSDMHYYLEGCTAGTPAVYPQILGHEPAGEIAAIGPGVERFKEGDRVAVEPALICGRCVFCRTGRRNLCENLRFMGGVQLPGLLREYAVVPVENVLRLPAEMDFATAAMIEPVAVLLHSLNLAQLRFGETVAVMGAGPIGLLALLVSKLAGASTVVVADKVPHRLKKALDLGADLAVDVSRESVSDAVKDLTGGRGAHVIFDAAGKAASLNASLHALRPGGRIVVIGIPSERETPLEFWQGLQQEATIIVQKRNNANDHDALELIESGRLDPRVIVSHNFSLANGAAAFETMGAYADGVIKPLIEM